MSSNDKLNGDGLRNVWVKVFELIKILTGNVDVAGKGNLQKQINDAVAIAKGRNQARVFATTAEMQTWLKNKANKGICSVGDNLYIVDVGVPDWWVSEVLDTADSSTGYYYKIAQLEVQKVDLSEYLKSTGDTKNNVLTFKSTDSTSAAGWTDVSALTSGLSHASIFNRVSTMFKNVRWLYKMLGTTDISKIEDGTVTGILSGLNTNISQLNSDLSDKVRPNYDNTVVDRTTSTITIEGDGFVMGFGRYSDNFRIGIYINSDEVFNNTFIGNIDYTQYTPYFKVQKGDVVTLTHHPEILYDFGIKIG